MEETQVSKSQCIENIGSLGTFYKCTLFKHEIEEQLSNWGPPQGGSRPMWGISAQNKSAQYNVHRLAKHKHTGPQVGPQVRLRKHIV